MLQTKNLVAMLASNVLLDYTMTIWVIVIRSNYHGILQSLICNVNLPKVAFGVKCILSAAMKVRGTRFGSRSSRTRARYM